MPSIQDAEVSETPNAETVGYDDFSLKRFLLLALPTLGLTIALFNFVWEELGLLTSLNLPRRIVLGSWLLESLGLCALFLLVRGPASAGRGGASRWLDGLAVGWIAWVFRGPLLVLTLVGAAGMSSRTWWPVTLSWLVLYTLCGLILAFLSHAARRDAQPTE